MLGNHIEKKRSYWVGKFPWRRDRLPTPVFLGFPGGSDGKESTCKHERLGFDPWLGRSPGGGHGNPLHYSCLEHPHGQRSLVGYSPWGPKESDMTEQLSRAQNSKNKENKNRKYRSVSCTVRKYYLTKHLFEFDIFVGVCVCVCVCDEFQWTLYFLLCIVARKAYKAMLWARNPLSTIPRHEPVFLSLALVHLAAEHDLQ